MTQIHCVPTPVRQSRQPQVGSFVQHLSDDAVFLVDRTVRSRLNSWANIGHKVSPALASLAILVCGVSIGSQASGYPQGHRK